MLTIVSFVVLLLVLIFVHELGHFLAAKLVGVKVERFSLGFPPKAVSRVIGETEYQLAWLPLGGYVKMYGDDPDSGETIPPEMEKRSFSHQKPWAKMVIVLAGPAFNLVFAVLVFWGLIWAAGLPHLPPVIGPVDEGGPAGRAGLRLDDVLVAVNGRPIQYFEDLDEALQQSGGAPVDLTVRRRGAEETHRLTPDRREGQDLFGDPLFAYGLGLGPRMKPVVDRVAEGQPAADAGLAPGDLITAIDGRPTPDWQDVLAAIQGPAAERGSTTPRTVKPLVMEIDRQGRTLVLEVEPELVTSVNASGRTTYTPMVGLESRIETLTERVGFFRAASLGAGEAAEMTRLTLVSVWKLVTGQISAKTLGGPILIAEVTGDRARAGLTPLLNLAAFISINLGILNLLPIPILDGGQLVFFLLEALRRRPLAWRVRQAAQWVGAAILGVLMVTVFYNDITRLVTRFSTKTEVERPAAAPAGSPAPAAAPGEEP